jgi:hypothetical protein
MAPSSDTSTGRMMELRARADEEGG